MTADNWITYLIQYLLLSCPKIHHKTFVNPQVSIMSSKWVNWTDGVSGNDKKMATNQSPEKDETRTLCFSTAVSWLSFTFADMLFEVLSGPYSETPGGTLRNSQSCVRRGRAHSEGHIDSPRSYGAVFLSKITWDCQVAIIPLRYLIVSSWHAILRT